MDGENTTSEHLPREIEKRVVIIEDRYGSLHPAMDDAGDKTGLADVGSVHAVAPLRRDGMLDENDPLLNKLRSVDGTEEDTAHSSEPMGVHLPFLGICRLPSTRRLALTLSLYINIAITLAKLYAYVSTWSLSVLAAFLDSVLDVVSQLVLNYTEAQSTMSRSNAIYPAGASRLEPIGVLTCAALMGMASFEVIKQSVTRLAYPSDASELSDLGMGSFYSMASIVIIKLFLLWLCKIAANKKLVRQAERQELSSGASNNIDGEESVDEEETGVPTPGTHNDTSRASSSRAVVQLADPTLEALSQDHWNDCLSNTVAAFALLCALQDPSLWFLDPVGAILISIYIIQSWYLTGKEQIEHLTGRSAPEELIEEIVKIASNFDERMEVDTVRAYHFGPKFLVEIEVVMPKETVLFESHDLGMELQYEIEARTEIERCFVHIDYQTRPYDEHVVSKVPELREKYRPRRNSSSSI